jgi:hypothetical protein
MAKQILSPGISPISGGTIAIPQNSAGGPGFVRVTGKEQFQATQNALKFFQFVTVSVPGNGTLTVQIPGDFVFVDTVAPASGGLNYTQLTIRPDSGNPTIKLPLAGGGVRFPLAFVSFNLTNPNATNMSLTLYVGFGDVGNTLGSWLTPVYVTTNTLTIQSQELIRPNNVIAYAAGQVVGQNPAQDFLFQAATLNNGGMIRIRQFTLYKSGAAVANAVFRCHLVPNALPPVVDQTAYAVTYPPAAGWSNNGVSYAAIDFPFMTAEGGGGGAICNVQCDIPLNMQPGWTQFTAILVAQAAYVPAAQEKFLLVATVDRL